MPQTIKRIGRLDLSTATYHELVGEKTKKPDHKRYFKHHAILFTFDLPKLNSSLNINT